MQKKQTSVRIVGFVSFAVSVVVGFAVPFVDRTYSDDSKIYLTTDFESGSFSPDTGINGCGSGLEGGWSTEAGIPVAQDTVTSSGDLAIEAARNDKYKVTFESEATRRVVRVKCKLYVDGISSDLWSEIRLRNRAGDQNIGHLYFRDSAGQASLQWSYKDGETVYNNNIVSFKTNTWIDVVIKIDLHNRTYSGYQYIEGERAVIFENAAWRTSGHHADDFGQIWFYQSGGAGIHHYIDDVAVSGDIPDEIYLDVDFEGGSFTNGVSIEGVGTAEEGIWDVEGGDVTVEDDVVYAGCGLAIQGSRNDRFKVTFNSPAGWRVVRTEFKLNVTDVQSGLWSEIRFRNRDNDRTIASLFFKNNADASALQWAYTDGGSTLNSTNVFDPDCWVDVCAEIDLDNGTYSAYQNTGSGWEQIVANAVWKHVGPDYYGELTDFGVLWFSQTGTVNVDYYLDNFIVSGDSDTFRVVPMGEVMSQDDRFTDWSFARWLGDGGLNYDVNTYEDVNGDMKIQFNWISTNYTLLETDWQNHNYFHMYVENPQDPVDFSEFTHCRVRLRGSEEPYDDNQQFYAIVQDSSSRYTSWGPIFTCIVNNPDDDTDYVDRYFDLSSGLYPRDDSEKADLSDTTLVGFHIKASSSDYVDSYVKIKSIDFYNDNVLVDGDFETMNGYLPWCFEQGAVAIDTAVKKTGSQSLKLSCLAADDPLPVVTSKPFPVEPGAWQFGGCVRADTIGSDVTYYLKVKLEIFSASNPEIPIEIKDSLFSHGEAGSEFVYYQTETMIPSGADYARFVICYDKFTAGANAWVDDLSARLVAPSSGVDDRYLATIESLDSSVIGNLFLPTNDVVFNVVVDGTSDLEAGTEKIDWSVRDCWGYTYASASDVSLTKDVGTTGLYHAVVNLTGTDFTEGVYYEIVVEPSGPSLWEVRNNISGFAVLPEAAAVEKVSGNYMYDAQDLHFGTQGYELRGQQYMGLDIAKRLGCRWIRWNLGWTPDENNIGETPVVVDCPSYAQITETVSRDLNYYSYMNNIVKWEKRLYPFDGDLVSDSTGYASNKNDCMNLLAEGCEQMVAAYYTNGYRFVKIGNEPVNTAAWDVDRCIDGYEAAYEGLKSDTNADVTVISTSLTSGNYTNFINRGFYDYCDIYNFHVYKDLDEQRAFTADLTNCLAEAGAPARPYWVTEMGTTDPAGYLEENRLEVADDLIAKHVAMFADGVDHISWYMLQAPSSLLGTFQDGFSLFSPYNAPRIDAIAYYHLMNSMLDKDFVAEKNWADGTDLFLFNNSSNERLLVLWNRDAVTDICLPMSGIGTVKAVYVDGRSQDLDANGENLTLRIGEEPIMLLYDGDTDPLDDLPASSGSTQISVDTIPEEFERGQTNVVKIRRDSAASGTVSLAAPPGWAVSGPVQTGDVFEFEVYAPADTTALTCKMQARLTISTKTVAELDISIPMGGDILISLTADNVYSDGTLDTNELRIYGTCTNTGSVAQTVEWRAEIVEEAEPQSSDPECPDLTTRQAAVAAFDGFPAGMVFLKAAGAAGGESEDVVNCTIQGSANMFYRIRMTTVDVNGRERVSDGWFRTGSEYQSCGLICETPEEDTLIELDCAGSSGVGTVCFYGQAGWQYQLLFTTNLNEPSWMPVHSNFIQGGNSDYVITVTNDQPAGFYQLYSEPAAE